MQEFAEFGFLRRGHGLVGDEVFDAHAPFARAVEAGFVGGNHARFHGMMGIDGGKVGDDLRAFVHVHEVAHAVPRAVAVVALFLPQGLAADGVEQGGGDVFGEHGFGQRDMGF